MGINLTLTLFFSPLYGYLGKYFNISSNFKIFKFIETNEFGEFVVYKEN